MNYQTKTIEVIFERPMEPIFTPRYHGKLLFDLPDSFYSEEYSGIGPDVHDQYIDNVEEKISVLDIKKPNLDFLSGVSRESPFSLFNPRDKKVAARLIGLLMGAKDRDTFVSLAVYIKDRLNPYLFQYAFAVAVQHRKDTTDVRIPPLVELFPTQFIEPKSVRISKSDASLATRSSNRTPVETPLNYTASDREEEHRMAYFREDIGVNLHHWHWHLVYPTDGPPEVVNKDRRGEIFWYMHHQMLARYNVDRFCNLLGPTKPLSNLRETLEEGYFPKIINSITNRTYAPRMPDLTLKDLSRNEIQIEIADLERMINRIQDAIDLGFVFDSNGTRIDLDEKTGIDVLFNIVESSQLSVNRRYYGDLHNLVHYVLAVIHDPDSRFLEDPSVMASVSTAMRDPIFYRWHTFIDNLGNRHKRMLPPYGPAELKFNEVEVDGIQVKGRLKTSPPNVLNTFWEKSDIDLGSGMDFAGPSATSYVRFTHLQHESFDYTITLNNRGSTRRIGTCRIFLVAKTDERMIDLPLERRRLLAIEMDKFRVILKPGTNRIKRRSESSSVTIPFENTFRRIDTQQTIANPTERARSTFCGCGWPEHMLLPKGTAHGRVFDLFVMISNYEDDKVDQVEVEDDTCEGATSFCGLQNKLFPDKRTMGFPFDRRLPASDFVELNTNFKNMKAREITIVFNDKFISR